MQTSFNTAQDMRDAVFFDGEDSRSRYSRFWLLLILAAIIASAGVVADSTATVIGAMIVAPLMTPILGTMLATVLGDRTNLIRSLLLVIAGALTAIAIGYLVGLLYVNKVLAENNLQVAGRVSPGLVDLLAALATGVVGSIALVRKDISGTLPGVAIAISLVPPLTVAGLTLESGSLEQSLGAMLLFLANAVAIIATGVVVTSIYGVHRLSAEGPRSIRRPVALIAVMLVVVGIPLALTSINAGSRNITENRIHDVADHWASSNGWKVDDVATQNGLVRVRVEGPLPIPDTSSFKTRLTDAGISTDHITVDLVPVYVVNLSD